jgi:hypothetical protein
MNCSVSPAPTRQSATSTYEQVPAMGAANERWPFPSTRPEIYLAMRGGGIPLRLRQGGQPLWTPLTRGANWIS